MSRERIFALGFAAVALTLGSAFPSRADIADYDVHVGIEREIMLDIHHRVITPDAPAVADVPAPAVEGPSASLQTTPIPGSIAAMPADAFHAARRDAAGLIEGRSTSVAPVVATCPAAGGAAQGAARLVFDPRPIRCGDLSARPFDFTAWR